MGLWDHISSTANSVKLHAVKAAQNLCSASYSYSCAAASKIGNAIRHSDAVQNLSTPSEMGQFASDCAINATIFACREGLKALPGGGPVFEIVSRSWPNNKKMNDHKKEEIMELRSELKDQKEKMKKLEAFMDKMGKENSGFEEVVNQEDVHELNIDVDLQSKIQEANKNRAAAIRTYLLTKSLRSNAKQPDDLIREMIMKGFISPGVVFDDATRDQVYEEHPL